MKEKTGIRELYGRFIKGNVIDMDFKEPAGFVPSIRRIMTPKEWQKRRQKLLKVKLP